MMFNYSGQVKKLRHVCTLCINNDTDTSDSESAGTRYVCCMEILGLGQ